MTNEGRVLGGRYRLGTELGHGAMGRVLAAVVIDGQLVGRECAVKVLDVDTRSPKHRDALRDRFLREIEIVKVLRGPHIVPIFDAGEESDGTLWLAMDRVSGPDLGRHVSEMGPLAPAIAFEIAAQAAQALQTAHALGIVHRDVKPSNLFLERLGPPPYVYLGDFGIGKIVEDGLQTRTIDVRYTPAYAAPEQFGGTNVSAATDVYGLGRTLYTLITGEVPLREHPLALEDLPPATATLLRQATADDAAERPTMKRLEAGLRSLATEDRPANTGLAHASLPATQAVDPGVPSDIAAGGSASSPRRRWAVLVGLAAAGMLALLVILTIVDGSDDRPSNRARVLLLVDLSEKMFCPQGLPPGACTSALIKQEDRRPGSPRPTRISAAKSFAGDGFRILRKPDDQLGISTFYSTGGRAVLDTKLGLGKVTDVAQDATTANVVISDTLANIEATTGGSPLRDTIDAGVDALRKDSPANGRVTNSLVVLTDGNENSSKITARDLRRKLRAGDPQRPVRVLVTAVDEALCEPLLPLVEATDGDCFATPDLRALSCASRNVLAALRRPHPAQPRPREQVVKDRECL